MNRLKNKFLSVLLSAAMVVGMLLPMSIQASAAPVESTVIDLTEGAKTIEEEGSYVVTSAIATNGLTVNCDAEITLEGVTINASELSAISIESGDVTLVIEGAVNLKGADNGAGIYVAEDASVTIKDTDGADDKLTAIGNAGVDDASGAAGIGGTWANGNSGTICIEGAVVEAKGYGVHGSGIGSGSGVSGEIYITDGAVVTAQGGYYVEGGKIQSKYGKSDPEGSAAIGGGGKTASVIAPIEIVDSTVTASGGSKAAGIGATFWTSCEMIKIENSTVTAFGGGSSAGIGTSRAGDQGVYSNIEITNSDVNAVGGDYGAGIGAGYNGDSLSNLPTSTVVIDGGTINATGANGGAGIGGGYKTNNVNVTISGNADVTATVGVLDDGSNKPMSQKCPSAIGSGANGSGTFNGGTVLIANEADVKLNTFADGKPAVEGFANDELEANVVVNEQRDPATVDSNGTWGGIDWTLYKDGTLVIAPTKGTPVADASGWTYEVGEWREAVIYSANGGASDIGGWPYDRTKVTSLVIEEGVTSIGSFTASEFKNLTGEVVIPSTVTYIGQEAFRSSMMTKLTFAEGGTEELCIAQGAFKKLIIEEVALPADRPVHLHAWVFQYCNNLKTVVLPATLTGFTGTNHVDYNHNPNAQTGGASWNSEIFANTNSMETITFESEEVKNLFYASNNGTSKDTTVATVGLTTYCDFYKALAAAEDGDTLKLLKGVTLSETAVIDKAITLDLNGKTVKGTNVFDVKANVEITNGSINGNLNFAAENYKATLTNCNVTGGFYGPESSVWEIKSGTYKAGAEAFDANFLLSGGTFHYEVKEEDCVEDYTVVDNGDGTYTVVIAYEGGTWGGIDWKLYLNGTLVIAPTKGTPVADANAPSRTYEVGEWREAVIYNADGVGIEIGGWPYDRSKVTKLVIEEGVTSIGSFTAQNYVNLTGEVIIPSTVTYIGQEAFQKSTMTELTFAEGGTEELCIAAGAFKNLIIEEVALPADRPVHLHAWVFNNCHNLKKVTIPATLTGVQGTNHNDYFKDFEAHSNPSWVYASEIFAYDENLGKIIFESEEVKDMFYASNNGTSKDYTVANVGLVTYCDLQEAIDAAQNGDTVELIKNVKLNSSVTIPAGKTITLDLNGKTISQEKACTASYTMIENKGNLTITGNGKISFKDTGAGDPNFGWGSYTLTNRGTLVVENGTIENLSTQNPGNGQPNVHMYCAIQQAAGSTTINGGKISTPTYRSVRINKGSLVVNGGVFEGQIWMQPNQGDVSLEITDGTFAPRGNDGSSIYMTNAGEGFTVTSAAISGGTFEGKIGVANAETLSGIITAGTFTKAAKDNTNEILLAEGHKFASNTDGTWSVKVAAAYNVQKAEGYDNLKDALKAAGANETIELLTDAELDFVIVPVDVTLNLNGYKLTAGYLASYGDVVDYSDANDGLLVVDEKQVYLHKDNEQLSIRDGEGYRFFEVIKFNTMTEGTKFVFQPFVEASGHELLKLPSAVNGVTLNVKVTWKTQDGVHYQYFVYNDDLVTAFINSYNGTKDKYSTVLTLLLTGAEGIADLTFAPVFITDTGIELTVK